MTGTLRNVNILIVDDSAHIMRLVNVMLRGMGVTHIFEAKTGPDALRILGNKKIDLALVDWMLDGPMNGIDLARFIRSSTLNDQMYMPIIMITGHSERENIEAARDAGVTEFLGKPFTAHGLFTRLDAIIDRPRPFVRTRNFFGPDRRRKMDGPEGGKERRHITPRREEDK